MRVIWKYRIPMAESFSLSMPLNAKILTFQTQKDNMYIWAMADIPISDEVRNFRIVETGQEIKEERIPIEYIGTIQQNEFVWHLFEEKK